MVRGFLVSTCFRVAQVNICSDSHCDFGRNLYLFYSLRIENELFESCWVGKVSESFIYMTCATPAEADAVGKELVTRRLVACVNIFDGMRSMYWWQGAVETAQETVLIAKTRTDLVDELAEVVKAMHGYEVPCVVVLPIEGGNPDFLDWIQQETRKT